MRGGGSSILSVFVVFFCGENKLRKDGKLAKIGDFCFASAFFIGFFFVGKT